MKICINCNAISDTLSTKCPTCKMDGSLRPYGEAAPVQHEPEAQKAHCPNCGTHAPGLGARCVQCRFPLPARKKAAAKMEDNNYNRAAGDGHRH